ncbi:MULTISPECIES: MFS transporter [unclassified Streptomyces]|uniref:MFS transporter n=1 Tax=unclassified Streptomyces TaxID=2593676 RepID=UPI002E2DDCFE|nr:MFS transporter [Streptomyces sp. NBC_01439]
MTTPVPGPVRPPAAVRPDGARRALVAGSVGNFIEWYEFGIYGYFASVIAAQFFTPEGGSEVEGLVKAYASFALAFFFRPVGAAVFGRFGDRVGRRPALVVVVCLMTGATAMIGLLPTYASIGAAAPWLLTLLRILQGLSAGGEFGGAVSVMTECAPPGRRGRYGAWQSFTVALGLLAGAAVAVVLASALTASQLHGWGWRVPFLLTVPLGLVALRLRLRLPPDEPRTVGPPPDEPHALGPEHRPERRPEHRTGPRSRPRPVPRPGETVRAVVLGIGRMMGWSAAGYTFLVVMPSYLQSTLGTTFQQALLGTVLANLGFAASVLPAGRLSDRIGRRTVMVAGALLVAVFALPLLHLVQDPAGSAHTKGAALFAAGAGVGLMAGPGPAMLAEMFPARVRCTGLGLAYALSNAVFSGCAGLIITEVIERTGNVDVPGYYAAATCAVSVAALLTLRGDDHHWALR